MRLCTQQRQSSELTAQGLFDLLSDPKGVDVDGYYLSVDQDLFGGSCLWLTSPYGVDCGVVDFTVEKCGVVLERIQAADPGGTERDPW